MSIVIQVNPLVEHRLREKAVKKGIGINQFISQFIENTFGYDSPKPTFVSEHEATLLQQINLDIPSEKWILYLNLKEKRQKKTLSATEHQELLDLINAVEAANARRIAVLAELAQLRNVPIRVLMEQLGLTPNYE